jgi:cupin fold WbuC family metalloprotein
MEEVSSDLLRLANQTSVGVFHAKQWGLTFGSEIIQELKLAALNNPRSRARLCLHPNQNDVHQEMLIVMHESAIEKPQRRTIGFDTKVVFEGNAEFIYYDDIGRELRRIFLSEDGLRYVHTNTSEFHSLKILSEWFVFLEVLKGPFSEGDTEFAPWLITNDGNCS